MQEGVLVGVVTLVFTLNLAPKKIEKVTTNRVESKGYMTGEKLSVFT